MKNLRKGIITALILVVLGAVLLFVNKTILVEEQKSIDILPSPMVMGNSGYTLSNIFAAGTKYQLVFKAKLPEEWKNFEPSGSSIAIPKGLFSPESPSKAPYITYERKGKEQTLLDDGFSRGTQLGGLHLEYIYKGVPQDISWIKVTFTYPDGNGNPVTFTTPEIKLKK